MSVSHSNVPNMTFRDVPCRNRRTEAGVGVPKHPIINMSKQTEKSRTAAVAPQDEKPQIQNPMSVQTQENESDGSANGKRNRRFSKKPPLLVRKPSKPGTPGNPPSPITLPPFIATKSSELVPIRDLSPHPKNKQTYMAARLFDSAFVDAVKVNGIYQPLRRDEKVALFPDIGGMPQQNWPK